MKKTLFAISLCFTAAFADAATVIWSASDSNGFSLSTGVADPVGNLVRVGSFDFTGTAASIDSQIQALQDNPTALDAHFVTFANGHVGDGGFSAGQFERSDIANTLTLGLETKQIYLWILASTDNSSVSLSVSTATQLGVFYMDLANNSSWRFPVQSPPTQTSIDITNLTGGGNSNNILNTGAHVAIGTFPNGNSTDFPGNPNFGLHAIPVPEPGSIGLAIVGGVALLVQRRRLK